MNLIRKILAWAEKNERHLGAVMFVGGFGMDVATFSLLDLPAANLLFIAYLAGSFAVIFLNHVLASGLFKKESAFRKTLLVIFPLAAQYLFGSLLSGFLIFYTKSSAISVSWPFLLLLAAVFIANEWFRKYRDRLAFLLVLLFFTAYMYALFALPLVVNALGALVFLESTAITVIGCGLFLLILWLVEKRQVIDDLMPIVGSSIAILLVVVISYFTGLLPPIPLTIKESGVYHSLVRKEGDYVVEAEAPRPWYDLTPQVVHLMPGESAYVFVSVFAPVRFATNEVHVWEHQDATGKWIAESRVSFPISGGRGGGYRGYSSFRDPAPGNWRVLVETDNGQVIGILRFSIEKATEMPPLHEETH